MKRFLDWYGNGKTLENQDLENLEMSSIPCKYVQASTYVYVQIIQSSFLAKIIDGRDNKGLKTDTSFVFQASMARKRASSPAASTSTEYSLIPFRSHGKVSQPVIDVPIHKTNQTTAMVDPKEAPATT